MLNCPRCGEVVTEHKPNLRWCRWFECLSCMAGYVLHVERARCEPGYGRNRFRYHAVTALVRGRLPRVRAVEEASR